MFQNGRSKCVYVLLAGLTIGGCERDGRKDAGSGEAGGGKARYSCVLLEHPTSTLPPRELDEPTRILARELLRQALLVCARDELGLSTRDVVLRESAGPPIGQDAVLKLVLTAAYEENERFDITVFQKPATQWAKVWTGSARCKEAVAVEYVALAEEAERLSRGAFRDTLISLGVISRPRPQAAATQVPPEVENLLWSLNSIDQYAGVRELHRITSEKGESIELLGGLARGYANLGVLTEMHWNVSNKVFKARGLLYAQRMVAIGGDEGWSLAHRAYVLALTGLHKDGLDDVSRARGLSADLATRPAANAPAIRPLPGWLEMVEAVCRVNSESLEEIAGAGEDFSPWAWMMRVHQFDQGWLSTSAGRTGMQFVREHPDCLRIMSMLSYSGQLGLLHRTTSAAFEEMDNLLRERLTEVPGLPADVQQLARAIDGRAEEQDEPAETPRSDGDAPSSVDEAEGAAVKEPNKGEPVSEDPRDRFVRMKRSLTRAGEPRNDSGEPSWTVLSRLIEEELFDHAQSRGWFLKHTLGVSSAEHADWVLPMLADHPFRSYIEWFRFETGEAVKHVPSVAGNIRAIDLDIQMQGAFATLDMAGKGLRRPTTAPWQTSIRAQSQYDIVVRDLLRRARHQSDDVVRPVAHQLYAVSPYHPVAASALVRVDWKLAEQHIAEWDQLHSRNPEYLGPIAKHYYKQGPPERAKESLERFIEVEPQVWAYVWLAGIYRHAGQEDKYVETLEQAFSAPDDDLAHTNVHITLADFFLRKKDLDQALAHGQAAAGSGSAASMSCLCRCYEAMGEMDEAEACVRRLSERYPSSGYQWFFWCRMTGHGSEKAAHKMAKTYFAAPDLQDPSYLSLRVLYAILRDEPEEASSLLGELTERDHNPDLGLLAALVADELGQLEKRDASLRRVVETGGRYRYDGKPNTEGVELARLFQAVLAGTATLDDKAIEQIIPADNEPAAMRISCFAGHFLQLHGESRRGHEYLLRASTSGYRGFTCTLARYQLRKSRTVPDSRPAASEPVAPEAAAANQQAEVR